MNLKTGGHGTVGCAVAVYGHRGARGVFPENTMPAFRYAAELGLEGIEIDVLLTRDRVPVVTHYPTLLAETTRGADGRWLGSDTGLVSEMTLDELKGFDVGAIRPRSHHAERFPDQAPLERTQIPTLDEVAALLSGCSGLRLNIEIKSYATRPELTAPPDVLACETLAVLARHSLADRVFVSSFDWRVLHAFRDLAPDMPRYYLSYLDRDEPPMEPNIYKASPWMDGCLLADHDGSLPQAIADLGGTGWCPHFGDLTASDLARAHALGLAVNVWTVNEPEDIQAMVCLGVDGIISDYPERVRCILLEQGTRRPQSDCSEPANRGA